MSSEDRVRKDERRDIPEWLGGVVRVAFAAQRRAVRCSDVEIGLLIKTAPWAGEMPFGTTQGDRVTAEEFHQPGLRRPR